MMVRYPVYRSRRDVHDSLYPVPPGRLQDVACPLDVGGVDVLRGVERQGRGGVDYQVRVLHRPVHERLVADVALYGLDPVPLRVVELLDVQRGERVVLRREVTYQVYPQKPGPARDQNLLLPVGFHRKGVSFCTLDRYPCAEVGL